jgi:hypothetical protein
MRLFLTGDSKKHKKKKRFMNNREMNNIIADAYLDQVKACIRDNVKISKNIDIVAAAVRIPSSNFPTQLNDNGRQAIRDLQECWSEDLNIDTVE